MVDEQIMEKTGFYSELQRDLAALNEEEKQFLPILSNSTALLYSRLPQVNWLGFYLLIEPDVLVLGPFQGEVACVRIPVGKGVCGTAMKTGHVQRVGDVHTFPGHIACDATSNAEIVLPVMVGEALIGVLDIDSRLHHRFDEQDEAGLKNIILTLSELLARTDIEKFILGKRG